MSCLLFCVFIASFCFGTIRNFDVFTEMEQQMIYKAAFHAYKVTNYLCLTLWTGFTVLAVVLKISLWPVTIVSAIWLTMAVSYAAEGKRLSKSKNEAGSAAGGNPLSF